MRVVRIRREMRPTALETGSAWHAARGQFGADGDADVALLFVREGEATHRGAGRAGEQRGREKERVKGTAPHTWLEALLEAMRAMRE